MLDPPNEDETCTCDHVPKLMVPSITKFFNREKKRLIHSLVTGMSINAGARYGLFELGVYIFLSSADCGRYGEVILRVGDAFYWPFSLSRGGCCREVSIRVNVWNVGQDEKSWLLWRDGHCREVAVSRGLAVCHLDFDHFFFQKRTKIDHNNVFQSVTQAYLEKNFCVLPAGVEPITSPDALSLS